MPGRFASIILKKPCCDKKDGRLSDAQLPLRPGLIRPIRNRNSFRPGKLFSMVRRNDCHKHR